MFQVPRGFWNGFVSVFQLFSTRGYTPPPPRPSDAEGIRRLLDACWRLHLPHHE